mgnify:FL=1|jgi:hypothetical protein|tara:strand:- start:550 stop:804 length:255 start_codon:yes stop_codon:yes gene_type:complete
MKKIRLTEKNLQNLIGKVVKESQRKKQRLNEDKVEVWCECGKNEGCYGSWGGGNAMDCTCCGELLDTYDDKFTPGNMGGMQSRR